MDSGTLLNALPVNVCRDLLGCLPLADLRSLLAVSRGLHRGLISAVLAAQKCLDSSGNCVILVDGSTQRLGPLWALQVSIDSPRLTSLAVTFSWVGDTSHIARELRRLGQVLEKFPTISRVSLDMAMSSRDAQLLGKHNHGEPFEFGVEFNALINIVARMPSIHSLQIATPFDWNLRWKPVQTLVGPQSRLIGIPHAAKSLFGRRSTPTSALVPLEFCMDSPILILPSSFKTTMALLSSRPISSLRLKMAISAPDWSFLLSEIANALPQLTDLTLIGIQLTDTQFVESILRFRALRTLTTDGTRSPSASGQSDREEGPPAPRSTSSRLMHFFPFRGPHSLSDLATISAAPELIAALFEHRVSLPSLSSVAVRMGLHELSDAPSIHSLAALRSKAKLNVNIDFAIEVHMPPFGQWNSSVVMCKTLDLALMDRPGWDDAVAAFIECRIRDFDIAQHTPTVLARWLALFRAVTRVIFAGESSLASTEQDRVSREILRHSHVKDIYFGEDLWQTGKRDELQAAATGPQLLDFPDEILLVIIEYLDSGLYALSRLSRRLHFLALPLYFSLHGMKDPSRQISFNLRNPRTGADMLSALNSALYLTTISDLACKFKLSQSIAWYLHDIERLTSFIARFPTVSVVSLTLVDMEHLESAAVNDEMRSLYRSKMGSLIDVILTKGCKSLSIRGAPLARPAGAEPAWSAETRAMPLSKDVNQLHSFAFSHTGRLSHAGLRWMFSALRNSHVTALSISAPRDSESELLTLVGKVLPRLTQLTITHGGNHFPPTLLNLLSVLPLLEKLTLPRWCPLVSDASGLPAPQLMHLKHLTAPPTVVLHLIGQSPQQNTLSNPLPALGTLVLLLGESNPFPDGWTAAAVLRAVKNRSSPISAEQTSLNIILDVAYSTLPDAVGWWHTTSGFINNESSSESPQPPIEYLTLTERGVNNRVNNQLRTSALLAIISQFSALRCIKIYKKLNFWFLASPLDWEVLGPAIARCCPQLETIIFNDDVVYSP
ncbi:hypothetical protein C8F01DRAFT_1130980 [Mycena amicta]|nr:hypothetical protein C8F01DRAFT_1130980 [Mycena amicta]